MASTVSPLQIFSWDSKAVGYRICEGEYCHYYTKRAAGKLRHT